MAQDFKKLEVWKLAHQFTLDIYRMTANFPKEEKYGMSQQFRRAAYSIGANISEGAGRKTSKDFARALYNSFGSVKEIENFLVLAKDVNYCGLKPTALWFSWQSRQSPFDSSSGSIVHKYIFASASSGLLSHTTPCSLL